MNKLSKFTRAGIVTAGLLLGTLGGVAAQSATAQDGGGGREPDRTNDRMNDDPVRYQFPQRTLLDRCCPPELGNFTPEWNSGGHLGPVVTTTPTSHGAFVWRFADDSARCTASKRAGFGASCVLLRQSLADQDGFFSTQGQGGYYLNDYVPDSDPQASHRPPMRAI